MSLFSQCVYYHLLVVLFIPTLAFAQNAPSGKQAITEKSEHFVVRYYAAQDRSWVKEVLRSAETYYDQMADRIGITHYDVFWTWENRTEIVIYSDKDAFFEGSGTPKWSRGSSSHHDELAKTHSIKTYKQDAVFIDQVLPHEITHLMLRDYIGGKADVPIWFEEGMAQLSEKNDQTLIKRFMQKIIREGAYVPVGALSGLDIRKVEDERMVAIFYLQSASIVQFLLDKYGKMMFVELLRDIKAGKNLLEALKATYPTEITGYDDLEKKWVRYMQSE